ncbi:Stk1 family PASTA domain-containing Ser/Thr kinase [Angustibacter sp. McL0619]|uniref:Stk1 family PASTA domain-containing Ser/Thr kinase n=1 Tax=Angustibacter sp. McL0619 TaxID=3415676 RepID=UPI003CF5DEC8
MNATPRLLGGRYEVGELLGRGGMADVHLGRDTRLGRSVAIKMLRSDLARDPAFQARFRREAQSAAALNHPAVVAVYDSGEEPANEGGGEHTPYIVMEYVEGRTLRELAGSGQRMDWREALRVTSGVLAALAYSHRAGIVHRDIKPANVMLTPTGDIKVMDFGIARAIADSSATMTQTQAVIGTAQYLSPEQARGETVDARSDLYSAGCLLFELLTLRPPFVADSPVAVAYQHVSEAAVPPSTFAPDVPEAVDAIVLHALQKDRGSRYQTADEFRADVDAAMEGRRISAAAMGSAAALGVGAAALATEAMTTVPPADGTTTLPPAVPEADMLPEGSDEPDKNRTGLWILLGLLAAALLAVGVLVLPGMLGGNKPNVIAKVAVPDLTSLTVEQATGALTAKGLVLGTHETQPDDTVPEGKVISQDPGTGAMVLPHSAVNVVISSGPDAVEVPRLDGLTKSQAEKALAEVGLKLGDTTDVESTEQDKGHIVSSNPASGDSVAKDTAVSVEIANGKVTVPNVVGQTVAEATTTLTNANLKVDATKYEESTQPEGTVIRQTNAGKVVSQGSTIQLVIAKAPLPPTSTGTPTGTGTPTATP